MSDELETALRNALKESGAQSQVESTLRAEMFKLMNNEKTPPMPTITENIVINELIKEYMQFNGYRNSLSVFMTESGHQTQSITRKQAAKQLCLSDESFPSDIPLLYGITLSKK